MLTDFLKTWVGENTAPFVAVALFVVTVGVALWATPRLAGWIDAKRKDSPDFYGGMMEHPPEDEKEE